MRWKLETSFWTAVEIVINLRTKEQNWPRKLVWHLIVQTK